MKKYVLTISLIINFLLFWLIAFSFLTARAASSSHVNGPGEIAELNGTATITRSTSKEEQAGLGSKLELGETLITSSNSSASIKFSDGDAIHVSANTIFTLGNYYENSSKLPISLALQEPVLPKNATVLESIEYGWLKMTGIGSQRKCYQQTLIGVRS